MKLPRHQGPDVRKGKGGRVEIDFVSEDELNRIYEHITDKR